MPHYTVRLEFEIEADSHESAALSVIDELCREYGQTAPTEARVKQREAWVGRDGKLRDGSWWVVDCEKGGAFVLPGVPPAQVPPDGDGT